MYMYLHLYMYMYMYENLQKKEAQDIFLTMYCRVMKLKFVRMEVYTNMHVHGCILKKKPDQKLKMQKQWPDFCDQ